MFVFIAHKEQQECNRMYKYHLLWLFSFLSQMLLVLTLTVLVATIGAQWEGMEDVGSARYEPALLPPCPTIKVLSYSNW